MSAENEGAAMVKFGRGATALTVIVLVASACNAATPASSVPSSGSSTAVIVPTASALSPTDSPAPVANPSPTHTPLPSSTPPRTDPSSPKPSPAVATWSKPVLIRKGECSTPTVAIDPSGRYHVASACDGGIRYLTSADGTNWTETSFVPAIDRLEVDPQLTLDGDTVYVAYSLLAPTDGGCGDDGLQDVGVYTRVLRNGSWTDPVRVGAVGDRVQSFRVVHGVLHLIVTSKDGGGPLFYESKKGSTVSRVAIPGAIAASLRVGDDGHARIAYTTGHAVRFARVNGAQLSAVTVAASTKTNLLGPRLVLGAGDRAHMIWTQTTDGGGGCVGPEPGPLDGVYFGTDASGHWKTTRLSKSVGGASLALDPSTGRIEVLVNDGNKWTLFTSMRGEAWTSTRTRPAINLFGVDMRIHPKTGGTSVFAVNDTGIYLVTAARP